MPVSKPVEVSHAAELPYLQQIFDELRRGKHLAQDDGPHVHALREHEQHYTRLFSSLGFTLIQHTRGFFYFAADSSSGVTELAARMAVFTFILVEHLADHGEQVENSLMTKMFNVTELPHLTTDRFMAYMRDVGVTSLEDLRQILKNMRRLGFAELTGDDLFRFRTPAYRFLDLCAELASEQEDGTTEDTPPSPAEDTEDDDLEGVDA